jgi:acyl carrier protein/short-subunit dehydrogenase
MAGDSDTADALADDTWRVNPSRPEHFATLLDIALSSERPLCGVVHLWSLDALPPDRTTPVSLHHALQRGCVSTLHLVQALAKTTLSEAPRLYLVTRGAEAAGETAERLSVAQSPLGGLARTIGYEHPELRCTRVDLDPDAVDDAQRLLTEVLSDDVENSVAVRGEERFVPRLRHIAPREAEASHKGLTIRSDGAYLITGGLGDLGLAVGQWLVQRGARHLVLMGRHPPSAPAEAIIQQLESDGAHVSVAPGDVSRLADVSAALRQPQVPPRGVIHAAGVLDDGILLQLDQTRFTRVMAAKVDGAWNLHTATADMELDFFLLFSSIGSLLGAPGQGNYTAANAFLDAFAHLRRASGLPATSINWGPWSTIGLAARQADRGTRPGARGMAGIPPGQALSALELVLRQDYPQIGVMSFDLPQWRRFYPRAAALPLLSELAPDAGPEHRPAPGEALRHTLAQLNGPRRRQHLESLVTQHISRVLRAAPDRIDSRKPMTEFGLDSLMAVEMRNSLELQLGLNLSATLVWRYPTVWALAGHLADKLDLSLDGVSGAAQPAVDHGLESPDRRSFASETETDLEARLAGAVDHLEARLG